MSLLSHPRQTGHGSPANTPSIAAEQKIFMMKQEAIKLEQKIAKRKQRWKKLQVKLKGLDMFFMSCDVCYVLLGV